MQRFVLGLLIALTASTAVAQGPREPIDALVRSEFYHGIPYQLIERYDRNVVPKLTEMLADDREREHWANIVWCLGVLGGEEAEAALIEFVERRFRGEIDPETWRAVLVTLPALGFIAHDPGTGAFRYLNEGVSPVIWRKRGLAWSYPALHGNEQAILMTKLAINGLGIAGNDAALKRLEDLRERLPRTDPELWRFVESNVLEATDIARRVQEDGYRRVFNPTEPYQVPR